MKAVAAVCLDDAVLTNVQLLQESQHNHTEFQLAAGYVQP
jgi:hypothetical protein